MLGKRIIKKSVGVCGEKGKKKNEKEEQLAPWRQLSMRVSM